MTQVILPVMLGSLLVIGMIVLISIATFKAGGDVGHWAAISTIWIVLPIIIVGLIFLAVLIGFIYLLSHALGVLPRYTGIAQDYVYKARAYLLRGADLVVRPVIAFNGGLEHIKAFIQRISGS